MKSPFIPTAIILLVSIVLGAGSGFAAQHEHKNAAKFVEKDGLLVVEAEHFTAQRADEIRRWYITSKDNIPEFEEDQDPHHLEGASNGAYVEILPDTRQTHGDTLKFGDNFSPRPGRMAIISFPVRFTTPGKYHVWARIYSVGTEDNGVHVGLNGEWPESGARMQWIAKRHWAWASKQRTEEVHTGVPGLIFLHIPEPGDYTIEFAMREDGFEMDRWLMTNDPDYKPEGIGPPESPRED